MIKGLSGSQKIARFGLRPLKFGNGCAGSYLGVNKALETVAYMLSDLSLHLFLSLIAVICSPEHFPDQ